MGDFMYLSFVSNRFQFLKPVSQGFGAVILDAVRLKKLRVFLVAAAILFPCPIQAEAVEPAKMNAVFVDSSFECREGLDQSTMQLMPFYAVKNIRVDGGTEGSGGDNNVFMPFSPRGESMAEPLSSDNSKSTSDERKNNAIDPSFSSGEIDSPFNHDPGEYPVFWISLWFSIVMFPLFYDLFKTLRIHYLWWKTQRRF
ncbi:MAG: hypothetical protein Q8J76_15245 [Desulfobulbaceae bacterium]|nr:hypothetical protein [Desulfobulbaceae bacterium]